MKIDLKEISIRELVDGFQDNGEAGVVGYRGKLDIRPPFQREFIYKDKQRNAVIETVARQFPLNVMYWAVRDDGYEIIDGQQRTISICQFVEGDFSVRIGSFPESRAFHNLQPDEREKVLNYKLMVYLCEGTDSEKLEWFKTINIAGERLTDQELRNAVYHGSWVTDAKRYFSKSSCPAHAIGSKYLSGSSIRQDYLETAIEWHSRGDIDGYMASRQHTPNAGELWRYFQSVVSWVEATFPHYRNEMKGLAWGDFFNRHANDVLDQIALEAEVASLMMDDDVTNKRGIYAYVLNRQEKYLNIRAFSHNERRAAYERQKGICPSCNKYFEIEEMHADHIMPWSKGGKTTASNCRMLCADDNRIKSAV
ncbi:HNH endonuclease family protein [Sinorhizobium meliloti]|uniref:HNH endonuclease family protein n=1 Tax=Rhizobium meliloti TaxID=382 RepID=UPI000FD8BB0E|nr:DUF262 domain-containing protein [Sinorhizobium meliloti]RVH05162.1 DUF262 domain-containing protein [Sinorhizobium meliloti]RVK74502.1 DUF262 domain-containing protein [Sinorhizobium meliloti]RVM18996.1 DUF262 domain-containing protein [Sinorhizobium meliloti]RVQ76943.1 DUF262 domain-containing protein [Sinorhizobium meliloti]